MISTRHPSLPAPPHGGDAERSDIALKDNSERVAVYDYVSRGPSRRRILVMKLDHHGDFLIGLPALKRLRAVFPGDHITLICGSWNAPTARNAGIVDEIRTYDYFPENAQNWDGRAIEDTSRFREACKGLFDIAIDLRVDEDTRPLLCHVDAALRCGIGSRRTFDYLNVALPAQPRSPTQVEVDALVFQPNAFHSRMTTRTPFVHETDFTVTDTHLIYGPYTQLPLGRLRAEIVLQVSRPIPGIGRMEIVVEVAGDGTPDAVALRRIKRLPGAQPSTVELEFDNDNPDARFEFRIFVGGHPRWTRLRFFGVRVIVLEKAEPPARFRPSELHIGEQLSLLVQLVVDRVQPLYTPDLFNRLAADLGDGLAAASAGTAKTIVIAPFSNSETRDWPLYRYIRLVGMMLTALDCQILLVGSRDQASQLDQICRSCSGDRRLVNLGGRTNWSELASVLRRADLVIANNSGVAHLAAASGTPTLAIYSGSHLPQEWGPRGESVRALTGVVACSPCGHEKLALCPHDHLCMKLIEPELVLQHALAMLKQDQGAICVPVQTSGDSVMSAGATSGPRPRSWKRKSMTAKLDVADIDPTRQVGVEVRKTFAHKLRNGFIDKYLSGADILDIGYKGYEEHVVPIVPQAIGVDLDYPGYDGRNLPFPDQSQDTVFSSHCLEHIEDYRGAIREWFRVLKILGFLIICVPHQYLYERRTRPPSRWNEDHRRFYTPASLLAEIEEVLEPNSYRIRHLRDNDLDYDYAVPADQHPAGCYEIELVIQKMAPPEWQLEAADPELATAPPEDEPVETPPVGWIDRLRKLF